MPRPTTLLPIALLTLILATLACGEEPATPAPAANNVNAANNGASNNANNAATPDASDDAPDDTPEEDAPPDAPDAADTTPDVVEPPPRPDRRLPDTQELGTRRGLRVARAIIHSHTVHSHDACDGEPRLDDGAVNEPCNLDWREGVCTTRQDFMFNTDHEELGATVDFHDLLLLREGDEPIEEDGVATANRMRCPDGFRPIVLPGGEYGVMPVGMKAHLDASPEERDRMYNEVTAERVASLRDLGAVVLQAHAESKPLEELRMLGLDGFEVYNLHANLAPDIREEWLGLDPFGFTNALAPFITRNGPSADLALLGFIAENPPALLKFDTLLAEGQHLVGTAGTDSHQNVLPLDANDGERVDSFRRMMHFFSNHLLVDAMTPAAAREALRSGRTYVAFETFGSPTGFDFYATDAAGNSAEMGERLSLADAPTLHLARPGVWGVEDAAAIPMRLVILRAEEGGAVEVASGDDALTFVPDRPGAWRAELRITPTHLATFLGDVAEPLLAEPRIWIYANPIYIDP